MLPDDKRHGTRAGYYAHRRDSESACQPCRDAAARAERARQWNLLNGTHEIKKNAIGVRRRLQALSAIGWSWTALSSEMGCSRTRIYELANLAEKVAPETHKQVADLYERLSMTLAPTRTRAERDGATKARTKAARNGWAPPLAWDDIDNDAAPNIDQANQLDETEIDEVAVQRFLHGDQQVPLTRAERRAVLIAWEKAGRPLNELERRTGWNTARMKREVAA